MWDKVFKDGPSNIMLRQTISLQIFWRLSSTNFTWSILEYLDAYSQTWYFYTNQWNCELPFEKTKYPFKIKNVILNIMHLPAGVYLFKVNNKDTRMTSMTTQFKCPYIWMTSMTTQFKCQYIYAISLFFSLWYIKIHGSIFIHLKVETVSL